MTDFEELDQRLGEWIRSVRLSRGMTQESVARAMTDLGRPTHQTTVAKLENGKRPTPFNELVMLSVIFGITVTELVEPVDPHSERRNEIRLRFLNEELVALNQQIAELNARIAELHRRRLEIENES